ncbi:MAG: hypothetical protein AAGF95_21435 [Chloroflexota bacterium]
MHTSQNSYTGDTGYLFSAKSTPGREVYLGLLVGGIVVVMLLGFWSPILAFFVGWLYVALTASFTILRLYYQQTSLSLTPQLIHYRSPYYEVTTDWTNVRRVTGGLMTPSLLLFQIPPTARRSRLVRRRRHPWTLYEIPLYEFDCNPDGRLFRAIRQYAPHVLQSTPYAR